MDSGQRRPRRMRILSAALAGVFALMIAGCSAANGGGAPTSEAGPPGDPITIGYVCLCSFNTVGEQSTEGAFTAWVNWTNAHGGVNGHPIRLLTANDPGNPGVAQNQVKSLVDQGIVALVSNDPGNDAAWAPYIATTGIPVFTSSSASLVLSQTPNVFSTLVSVAYQPMQNVQAAKKAGASKLAVFYCAELATCKQTVPALESVGGPVGVQVVFSTSMLSSAPNYTAQCLAARDAGADALFIASISTAAALRVIGNCAQQGYNPRLVSSGAAFSKSFEGAPGTEGMIASEPTAAFFDDGVPEIRTMNAAFDQYVPGLRESADYSDTGAWQWTTGMLIAEALKSGAVGTTKPITARAVLDGLFTLHTTDLGGMTPPLTFVEGQPQQNKCWFYVAMQNGKLATPYGREPTCAP